MANNNSSLATDDVPRIRIADLLPAVKDTYRTGQPAHGTITMYGHEHTLDVTKLKDTVRVSFGQIILTLVNTPSNLIPDTVGCWYFVCPVCGRHCSDLYLPAESSSFACRLCHHLAYRSKASNQHGLLRKINESTGIEPELIKALLNNLSGE